MFVKNGRRQNIYLWLKEGGRKLKVFSANSTNNLSIK